MRSSLRMLLFAPMLMLASCESFSSQHPQAVLEPAPALAPRSTPTPQATGGIKVISCASLHVIELSHADTDGTKAQVIPQNDVIDKGCGPR